VTNPYGLYQEPPEQCKLLLQEYTTQLIAHAGYLITAGFAIISLTITLFEPATLLLNITKLSILIVAILITFFFFIPRLFYYTALTAVTKKFLGIHGTSILRILTDSIDKLPKDYFPIGMESIIVSELLFEISKNTINEPRLKGRRKSITQLAIWIRHGSLRVGGKLSTDWSTIRLNKTTQQT